MSFLRHREIYQVSEASFGYNLLFERARPRGHALTHRLDESPVGYSCLDFGLTLTKVLANGKEKPMFASEYLQKHNDVVLKFLPTFKHIDNGTSANLTNFGIDVRRPSGILRVDPGPIGKPFPGNFLLEITATHRGVAPKPVDVTPLSIRVHVHESVERIWITAKELTVRRRTGSSAEDSIFVEEPTGGLESYPPFLMIKFGRDFRCLKRRAILQRVGSK